MRNGWVSLEAMGRLWLCQGLASKERNGETAINVEGEAQAFMDDWATPDSICR